EAEPWSVEVDASTIRPSFLAAPARPATTRHHHPPRPTPSHPGRRSPGRPPAVSVVRAPSRCCTVPRGRLLGRVTITHLGGRPWGRLRERSARRPFRSPHVGAHRAAPRAPRPPAPPTRPRGLDA